MPQSCRGGLHSQLSVSMGSTSANTEGRLSYTILCKGCECQQILVPRGNPRTNSPTDTKRQLYLGQDMLVAHLIQKSCKVKNGQILGNIETIGPNCSTSLMSLWPKHWPQLSGIIWTIWYSPDFILLTTLWPEFSFQLQFYRCFCKVLEIGTNLIYVVEHNISNWFDYGAEMHMEMFKRNFHCQLVFENKENSKF